MYRLAYVNAMGSQRLSPESLDQARDGSGSFAGARALRQRRDSTPELCERRARRTPLRTDRPLAEKRSAAKRPRLVDDAPAVAAEERTVARERERRSLRRAAACRNCTFQERPF